LDAAQEVFAPGRRRSRIAGQDVVFTIADLAEATARLM
jgi:hypothetical protein